MAAVSALGTSNFWTDHRVDALKALLGDGLSASQIAAQLGTTRNAVIGKVHRDGFAFASPSGGRRGQLSRWTDARLDILQERKAAGARDAVIAAELGISEHAVRNKARRLGLDPRHIKTQRAALGGLTRTLNLKTAQATHSPTLVPELPPRPRKPGGVSIFELTERTCRWPIGTPGTKGFYFCGDEPGIGPYCREHGLQAYDPRFLPGR